MTQTEIKTINDIENELTALECVIEYLIASTSGSYLIIDIIGSLFKLLHDLLTIIENTFFLIELFPGLFIHFLDPCPVHFDSILKLLYSGLYLFADRLEFVFDVALQSVKVVFHLGYLQGQVLGVFVGLLQDLRHVAYLDVERRLHGLLVRFRVIDRFGNGSYIIINEWERGYR